MGEGINHIRSSLSFLITAEFQENKSLKQNHENRFSYATSMVGESGGAARFGQICLISKDKSDMLLAKINALRVCQIGFRITQVI